MVKKIKFIIIPVILIILVVVILLVYSYSKNNQDPYSFKGTRVYYSQDRSKATYNMALREKNISYDVYNISFDTKKFLDEKIKIYGILFMPRKEGLVPGVVLSPGGSCTKRKKN